MVVNKKKDFERGDVVRIKLKRKIVFNDEVIEFAIIEKDHINYGLSKRTKKLNKKPRSNFTVNDIEKFIMLLDNEDIVPIEYRGHYSVFAIRVDCPIKRKDYGKQYVMVFKKDYRIDDEIHTITLYPAKRK
jgi:hypothetical protein